MSKEQAVAAMPFRPVARQEGAAGLSGKLEMALEGDLRGGISLLAGNAPITQIFELDRQTGHRAAHMVAFRQNLEIGVKKAKLGLSPGKKEGFMPIHRSLDSAALPRFEEVRRASPDPASAIAVAWALCRRPREH